MAQNQTTGQRIKQTPKKMQISSMIERSDLELEQLIREEAEKNIALEIVDPGTEGKDQPEEDGPSDEMLDNDYMDGGSQSDCSEDGALTDEQRGDKVEIEHDDDETVNTSSSASDKGEDNGHDIFAATASETTFREDLKQQIDELDITEEERYLAHYIIDCLEDDGYLRRPLFELVDDLEFNQHHLTTEEDLEAVLVEIVQEELEPSGIGARDLRECLLLQVQERKGPAARFAYMVLNEEFDELVAKHYDTIREHLGISSHSAWVEVMRVIHHLNPKPGNMEPVTSKSSEAAKDRIRPDFFVRNEDDQFVITLNDVNLPEVRVSVEEKLLYESLKSENAEKEKGKADADKREGEKFLRDSIQRAESFIDSLEQRRSTMLAVMEVIVSMQRSYFLTGLVENLLPMTLEDVEKQCDYDKSTISRVTSSKYADTQWGIILLKDLFSNAVGETTQTAIVDALRQIIDEEDKSNPLTDDALVEELKAKGFDIARRTVAKYRGILKVGSAKERRFA